MLRELVTSAAARARADAGTDLAAALDYANRVLHRRAVVFVLSDWMTAGYDTALGNTAHRHDTIAVQLVDPRERTLPDVGLITLRDPETDAWRTIDTARANVRAEFTRRGSAFDADLTRGLRRLGVDLVRLETARSAVPPLLAFFRRRERRMPH